MPRPYADTPPRRYVSPGFPLDARLGMRLFKRALDTDESVSFFASFSFGAGRSEGPGGIRLPFSAGLDL
jgi:hypothetical protein